LLCLSQAIIYTFIHLIIYSTCLFPTIFQSKPIKYKQSDNKTTNRSINLLGKDKIGEGIDSYNPLINQLIKHSICRSVNQPTSQPAHQPTSQSICQPFNQSTNQSINLLGKDKIGERIDYYNPLLNQSIKLSISRPVNQPISQPAHKPTSQSIC
jgi:hypothetical protein